MPCRHGRDIKATGIFAVSLAGLICSLRAQSVASSERWRVAMQAGQDGARLGGRKRSGTSQTARLATACAAAPPPTPPEPSSARCWPPSTTPALSLGTRTRLTGVEHTYQVGKACRQNQRESMQYLLSIKESRIQQFDSPVSSSSAQTVRHWIPGLRRTPTNLHFTAPKTPCLGCVSDRSTCCMPRNTTKTEAALAPIRPHQTHPCPWPQSPMAFLLFLLAAALPGTLSLPSGTRCPGRLCCVALEFFCHGCCSFRLAKC
ncbi:hypothetical protein GQ53DRAFT_745603 [Thozetella sp. PMI_491]|nr:hypothetical protein GQ53DRAFT_745603 [Thozetella sp. PMI_491]